MCASAYDSLKIAHVKGIAELTCTSVSSPAVPCLQCFSDRAVKPEISAHMQAAFTKKACDSRGFDAFSKYCERKIGRRGTELQSRLSRDDYKRWRQARVMFFFISHWYFKPRASSFARGAGSPSQGINPSVLRCMPCRFICISSISIRGSRTRVLMQTAS